jgi:hypothetical protein
MSAPIRFLGLAIVSYVGLRTASSALALQPADALPATTPAPDATAAAAEKTLPPGVPADMGPPPADSYAAMAGGYGSAPAAYGPPPGAYPQGYGGYPYPYAAAGTYLPPQVVMMPYPVMPAAARRVRQPVYYAAPEAAPPPAPLTEAAAMPFAADGYAQPLPALEQWPAIGTAGPFSLGGGVTPRWGKQADPQPLASAQANRWSVDAWAMLRPPREGVYRLDDPDAGINPGLAPAGSLGGSQAGMRITWKPLSSLGVHLRASTALIPKGRSASSQALAGGEGSLGVSWQPLKAVPVRVMAERRQRLGSALGGGRNAWALLAEGGLYERPLPFGFTLDGYGQAGVIGANHRDLFADGGFTATYPFMPRFAVGGGLWGGIQPGLSRLDAGPRLSYQLRPGLRAHLDYRFRLTGNADPVNGPAFTLAAGF